MGLFSSFTKSAPTSPRVPQDRVVGIDIGASAIKVVELQDRSGVVTLTTYGELQLGPYVEKPIGQPAALTPPLERQALVDVLRESAVKAGRAVLAMPLQSSFVTVMSLVATEGENIEPRVRIEARKYIPVPIADVALDWAEITAPSTATDGTRDVLVAAIQNDALLRFSTLMQTVEFKNPPTEIECFSALRSTYKESITHSAVIDIGAQSAKLYIAHKGILVRMHRVPYGGATLNEQMVKETGDDFTVIETEKRNLTASHPRFALYQKQLQAGFGRVLREFAQVMSEYETRTGSTVEQVYLSGGATLLPGVEAFVSNGLSRPASYAQPFEKVAYPAFMEDTLRVIGPTFATALGAALRSFE